MEEQEVNIGDLVMCIGESDFGSIGLIINRDPVSEFFHVAWHDGTFGSHTNLTWLKVIAPMNIEKTNFQMYKDGYIDGYTCKKIQFPSNKDYINGYMTGKNDDIMDMPHKFPEEVS